MNKYIKLLERKFPFRKSAYSYKHFEDRNKRAYNPALASDILEYIYSCIVAGYFYTRLSPEIDEVDFYELIDKMEEIDAELLYKDNKELFADLLGIKSEVIDDKPISIASKKKK